MNKMLSAVLLGVSLTTSVKTAGATNQYFDQKNDVEKPIELKMVDEIGSMDCIWWLCGSEQGVQDDAGDTALICAAQKGKAEAAPTLIKFAPVELGRTNNAGLNALKSVILFGNTNCVQILMRTKELFAVEGNRSVMDFAKEILDIQKDADSQQIYTVMVNMLEEAEAKAQK